MPYFLVESQSVHRIFYVVKAESKPNGNLKGMIDEGKLKELGQTWLGDSIVGIDQTDTSRVIKKFHEVNEIELEDSDILSAFVNELDNATPDKPEAID